MEKLEWLQAFAEPEQPETGAAAPTPEQQERLAALSPEGTQALTQEQREAAMRQGYARLKAQFAAVQAVYPQAELSRALEDPRFLRLVTHGVDAKSAYELTHLRELTAEAMAYGARRAREELTAAMQAGYLRPRESGLTPGAGGAFAESPELIHTQFARKQVLPAGRGKTVEWRKWNTLEDAGALTEGVIPTGQKFGQSAVTQAVTQYGTYVSVSDQLELHAIDDVILGAAEELGASAGTTQDKLVRNVVVAGTNVQYCDKVGTNGAHTAVTSRAGLDTTAKLTPDEVNKAVTLLKKLKAPKIDGKYVAIIHPSVAYDLRSSDAWVEAHKYAGITELFTGEIGELHGVRFIETTEAKVFNGEGCPVKTEADESKGTPAEYYSVYATLFLGKDAYGMIDPEGGNMEMIIKDKGQVGGPLNQFSTLGYKFSSAAKILYQDRMVRVESCGAYSAEDEAN